MTLLETSIYSGWWGKQAAKGTAVAAGSVRRIPWIDDDFNVAIDDGEVQLSDLSLYGARYRYRNTIQGSGSPNVAAIPSETAYGLWLAHGGETVTAGTNEVQTAALGGATGGSAPWSYSYFDPAAGKIVTESTAALAFNAAAAAVQTALQGLTGLGAGNVTVAGAAGGPYTVTFTSAKGARPHRALVIGSGLTGGTGATVTRTTPGVRVKHSFKPTLGTPPFWLTFYRRVGLSVIQRSRMVDALISGWALAAGNGNNKVMRFTPTILALQPAQWQTSDPADAFPTEQPWLYTDGKGSWTFGAEVYPGQSQFNISGQQERTPVYGDDTTPYDMSVANASFTLGATLLGDQQAMDLLNEQLYGTASPIANQAPLGSIPSVVSYGGLMKQREPDGFANGYDLDIHIPGVQLNVPASPGPAPGGGSPELAFTGTLFPVAGQDPYTVAIWCDEPAFS